MLNIFIFFVFFNVAWSADKLPDGVYLVNGCKIFNNVGAKVKEFPGRICLFHPDGRVILATETSLRMLNPKLETVWELPVKVHHQLTFSTDKKSILALLSENKKMDSGILRQDRLAIISLDGKILSDVIANDLLKQQIAGKEPVKLPPWIVKTYGADFEQTHFNSIYEIPANSSKIAFLKSGNIIVNSIGIGACVLTPDLKTVLDCRTFPSTHENRVHDVQITPEGNYIYFNNEASASKTLHSSAVDEFNPASKKITFHFAANPAVLFYSPICGGVQVLDKDYLLVSHVQNGAYVIHRKSRKVMGYFPYLSMEDYNMTIQPTQQIKAAKLSSFLSAWEKEAP